MLFTLLAPKKIPKTLTLDENFNSWYVKVKGINKSFEGINQRLILDKHMSQVITLELMSNGLKIGGNSNLASDPADHGKQEPGKCFKD